jgi:hypothetical protein
MCGSSAVSTADREDADEGLARWLVRCGACETWRTDVLTRRQSRRLARRLARDRRRLVDSLLQLSWVDPTRELGALDRQR